MSVSNWWVLGCKISLLVARLSESPTQIFLKQLNSSYTRISLLHFVHTKCFDRYSPDGVMSEISKIRGPCPKAHAEDIFLSKIIIVILL